MRYKTIFLFAIFLLGFSAIAAQTKGTRTISGGVVNGKAISLPVPEYPAAAKAVGASGSVKVQVLIDVEGNVISAEAISGHPLLRSSSENAALQAQFRPTLLSGTAVNVSGVIRYDFVPPITPNYAEQLKYLGLGAFLTGARIFEPEEWEPIDSDLLGETPELADELKPLTLITSQTSLEERARIIKEVSASMENKLNGDDAWQYEFGRLFGEAIVELKSFVNGNADEAVIKEKLGRMQYMLAGAPADFPPEILRRFTEITKYADAEDFYTLKNLTPFMDLLMDTFNIILPNEDATEIEK